MNDDAGALERLLAHRQARTIVGAASVAIFLIVWQIAGATETIRSDLVSYPTEIAHAAYVMAASGELGQHAVVSLQEFAQGFAPAVVVGVLLDDLIASMIEFCVGFGMAIMVGVLVGVAMGLNRIAEYAIDPFVWFLYASPLIAFYPLLIVWLGFGFATVVAVAFLLSFVSIVVNAMAGVHSVEPNLVKAVLAFGGTRRDVVLKVVLPASIPHILAGGRIGLGRALHGVVLGEMFGSNDGLGYSIARYAAQLKTADVFAPLLTLIVLGIVINQASGLLESRLLSWRRA